MKHYLFNALVALCFLGFVSCGGANNQSEKKNLTYTAVDLGLPSGLKWATTNLGASSPEEYGDYFAWGEVSSKSSFHNNNYTGCDYVSSKYDADGYLIKQPPLDSSLMNIAGTKYDAALAIIGGSWSLPTSDDFEELLKNCTWTDVEKNGVKGYKVQGKNGNHIFLPLAGRRRRYNNDSGGYYWSATAKKCDWRASCLWLNSFHPYVDDDDCDYGLTIRPVQRSK